MQCPACSNTLTSKVVGGVEVDVCKNGCGGIWFDQVEIEKFDEAHEEAGRELLDIPRDPAAGVDPAARRHCPKCGDVVMMQHFFDVKKKVAIDECPSCAGIWLDAGELSAIRELYPDEDQRNAEAKKYFSETVGPELDKMRAETEHKRARAQKFASMFRWICPSNYIPGDQAGGAF